MGEYMGTVLPQLVITPQHEGIHLFRSPGCGFCPPPTSVSWPCGSRSGGSRRSPSCRGSSRCPRRGPPCCCPPCCSPCRCPPCGPCHRPCGLTHCRSPPRHRLDCTELES